MNEPKMKEIYSVEYSTSYDMSNEEVIWALHSITMESIAPQLDEKELSGKNLKLIVQEYVEE